MHRVLILILITTFSFSAIAEHRKQASAGETVMETSDGPTITHEILASSTVLNLQLGSNSTVGFNLGYEYTIIPDFIQLGLLSSLQYLTQNTSTNNVTISTSTTSWTLLAGPTFNFPFEGGGMRNAFFANISAGFVVSKFSIPSVSGGSVSISTSVSSSDTSFALTVTGGKRFQIFSNVIFRPEIGFQVVGGNVAFRATPISISVAF